MNPVNPRSCEVCGRPADPEQTSAHVVRVHYLCTTCGEQFHAHPLYSHARGHVATHVATACIDALLFRLRRERWADSPELRPVLAKRGLGAFVRPCARFSRPRR